MKIFPKLVLLVAVIAPGHATEAQSVKTYVKDGLSFNYPSGWQLHDTSSPDKQEITLAAAASDVQIRLFVYRGNIATPEQLAEARSKLVEPYIEGNFKTFQRMAAKPERSAATSEIGGVKAEGVKIRAVLDEPGTAETYWALVGQRLVVMTFFGPDKDLKKLASAWDTVRSSVQTAEAKPEAKPSPTATPQESAGGLLLVHLC